VRTRKPIFVRWAEEAEAKQVSLWAGLERDASATRFQSSSHGPLPRCWRAWARCFADYAVCRSLWTRIVRDDEQH
jgi:hypothetical protein